MKTTLKRFALALMLGALAASCGSDNATNTGDHHSGNNNNSGNINITGNSNGARTFSEFRNEVNAGRFKNGSQTGLFYFNRVTSSSNNSNCSTYLGGFFQVCSYSSGSTCRSGNCGSTRPRRLVSSDGTVTISNFEIDEDFGNTLQSRKNRLVNLMANADKGYKCLQNIGCLSEEGMLNYCEWQYGYTWNSELISTCYENLRQQRSKVFAFDSNGHSYIVNLDRPLGANPTHIGKLGESEIYIIAQ